MDANPLLPDPFLALVLSIVLWLLGAIITLVILWAIIRGAVLSALRKHADEQLEAGASRR